MDTAQWPQGIGVSKITSMEVTRKGKPHKDETPLNCPRCSSTNTKFCYYNNYNLSQPRYFCKTCRRYWTVGGSLRNVPVGGGSRKHKRLSSSSTSTIPSFSNPKVIINQGQDLNLSYPSSNDHKQHDYNSYNHLKFIELPPNPSSNTTISSNPSRGGLLSPSFNTTTIYNSPLGFAMQDFKPTLNFPLDGFENGYGHITHQGVPQNGASASSARLLFPYEELKLQISSTNEFDGQHRSAANNGDDSSTGYWINGNGMLGGGVGGSW